MSYLPYALSIWLFLVGLYGVVTSRNLVHLAVCLTVCQSSTYVLLLAIGYRKHATAPIFKGIPLQLAAMLLVGAAGLGVVLARDLLRQALLNSFFGLLVVVLFLVFQAPDVALSALAVGAGAAPLVILAALAKLKDRG